MKAPKGSDTRPTSDRVKEAVFAILTPCVVGCSVLDLYAGSGALGIEALSRGADTALFVDRSLSAVRAIEENLSVTGFASSARVMRAEVCRALSRLGRAGEAFGIVFADPPYGCTSLQGLLQSLVQTATVAPEGLIVLESSVKDSMGESVEGLSLIQSRSYGDTSVCFYRRHLS